MNNKLRWMVVGGVFLALAGIPATAQVASALLQEDGTVPGGEEPIASITTSAVNQVGGYAFGINTSVGGSTVSYFWGNPAGGAGYTLRGETTIGDFEQTSFESWFGLSDTGQIAYSPSCTNLVSGSTGLDGVWVDDTWISMEEEPYPHQAGWYWRYGSRAFITGDGQPYWKGGITDTQGGSTQNAGFFFGTTATPLLIGGQSVPNLPFPLSTTAVNYDYRFSAYGTNWMAEADMDTSSTSDNAVVLNGEGLFLGGALVREGSPLPASVGGLPDENWDNFDFHQINEAGTWMITGDSDTATSMDEFVVMDGQIILREGDLVGGYPVAGNIECADLNEAGDYALTWEVNLGGTNYVEALILNGELILKEGDLVDWNGDGVIDGGDEGAWLEDFTGTSDAMHISEPYGNGLIDIYFTADVDIHGNVLEGAFKLTVPEPGTLSLLALGALALLRRR